ncbi:hypothetical protein C3Z09_08260 [Lelliottia aquatilis]|uniref:hypothetical protein n=1 Tax=Lelliottia aquatilis TaxID=2080838 RepID=UPI000D4D6BA7|nr:hypothetical protein [Lelliottia aquatilis]POZ17029.1 hypothetical protein C3Z09_08260 [Lelliottia aquatilis]
MNNSKSTHYRAEGEITALEEMNTTIAFLKYYVDNPDMAIKQSPHLLSVIASAVDYLRALLNGEVEPEVYQYRIFDPEYDTWGEWDNCSEYEFERYYTESLNEDGMETRKLYSTSYPALVVPMEITEDKQEEAASKDWADSFRGGWNACRATMLNGGKS